MSHAAAARNLALTLAAVVLSATVSLAADTASALFKDKCSSCHGIDGSSKTAAGKKIGAADLHSKAVIEMSDQEMFETIGRGVKHKNYPHSFLYTGLNEQQVRNLVTYIRQLQKEKQ